MDKVKKTLLAKIVSVMTCSWVVNGAGRASGQCAPGHGEAPPATGGRRARVVAGRGRRDPALRADWASVARTAGSVTRPTERRVLALHRVAGVYAPRASSFCQPRWAAQLHAVPPLPGWTPKLAGQLASRCPSLWWWHEEPATTDPRATAPVGREAAQRRRRARWCPDAGPPQRARPRRMAPPTSRRATPSRQRMPRGCPSGQPMPRGAPSRHPRPSPAGQPKPVRLPEGRHDAGPARFPEEANPRTEANLRRQTNPPRRARFSQQADPTRPVRLPQQADPGRRVWLPQRADSGRRVWLPQQAVFPGAARQRSAGPRPSPEPLLLPGAAGPHGAGAAQPPEPPLLRVPSLPRLALWTRLDGSAGPCGAGPPPPPELHGA